MASASAWKAIAESADTLLARLPIVHSARHPDPPASLVTPLALERVDIRPDLTGLGCTATSIDVLANMFDRAADSIGQTNSRALVATVCRLGSTFEGDRAGLEGYEAALRQRLMRDNSDAVRRLRSTVLAKVQAAQAAVEAASAGVDAEAKGTFTEEVVSLLERAYEGQSKVSRAERRALAGATGLNEKQVATWVGLLAPPSV
jgi:hypothetical protein